MDKTAYPNYMIEFYEMLVNDYKMPEQLAQDCMASYNKDDMSTITRFMKRYESLMTLPRNRYGYR